MDEAMKFAKKIWKGPVSISLAQQAINRVFDLEMDDVHWRFCREWCI